MGLIARECPTHGPIAVVKPGDPPGAWTCNACGETCRNVEYVRASTASGAVRERDTFARALTLAVGSSDLREAYVRQAEDALSRSRGQSS